MSRRFDTIPACDGQTDRRSDRRTDGRTYGIAVANTGFAMRALRRAVMKWATKCAKYGNETGIYNKLTLT